MNQLIQLAQELTREGDLFLNRFGPQDFHHKAYELLEKTHLHQAFDFSQLVEASFLPEFNHPQNYASAQFSDFPITIGSGEHCFLDLYFWRRRPTVIHNHHFTGAFQALRGVNVDLEFEYKKTRSLGRYHDLGELTLKQTRKLKVGEIAPIDLLDKFIHQNHHQDDLTINACFRTPDHGQTNLSNYLYSGLRFEKHPLLLDRTQRLMNFIFMGEVKLEKLQLDLDDAINFLIRYGHSTSQSNNFLKMKSIFEKRLKDELGLDIKELLAQHQLRMDELENNYN